MPLGTTPLLERHVGPSLTNLLYPRETTLQLNMGTSARGSALIPQLLEEAHVGSSNTGGRDPLLHEGPTVVAHPAAPLW